MDQLFMSFSHFRLDKRLDCFSEVGRDTWMNNVIMKIQLQTLAHMRLS